MRASLIVAAGGSSSRFKSPAGQPAYPSKLFMPLDGHPLLARTVSAFQSYPRIAETILAVPEATRKEVKRLAKDYGWKNVKVIPGGGTRSESVFKALKKTGNHEWVMVHDGARPFIHFDHLEKLFKSAQKADGVILAKKVVPTIKKADAAGRIRQTLDRSMLFEAETPQLVKKSVLQKAYRRLPHAFQMTDEASLLEAVDASVQVLPHTGWNPKITTYEDWQLAEAFLKNRGERIATGFGRDLHRLVKGRIFWLGGMKIPFDKGPLGHSDGDVLLHAVIDALLGAAGKGDIGEWFSDRDAKFKNIASSKMLEKVYNAVRSEGWRLEHVDTTVFLEKPKLSPYKQRIKALLARLLEIPEDAVSVKAKTMEGLGEIGEGLAVSAEAVVTMRKREALCPFAGKKKK